MKKNAFRVSFCGGILFGIWIISNQGRYKIRQRLLDVLRKTVVLTSSPSGKDARGLSIVTGSLFTSSPCVDPDFKIKDLPNCCKLSRKVEMYQWQETKERNGKCSYQKTWSSHRINSNAFRSSGFENPRMLISSREFSASDLSVRGFNLECALWKEIRFWEEVVNLELYFGGKCWRRRNDGWFYSSNDEDHLLGDLRVRFTAVLSNIVITVLAAQFGPVLKPFTFDPRIYDALAESGNKLVGEFVSPSIVDLIVVFVCGIESNAGKVNMTLSSVRRSAKSLQTVFNQLQSKETIWKRLEFGTALILIAGCITFLAFDLMQNRKKNYN